MDIQIENLPKISCPNRFNVGDKLDLVKLLGGKPEDFSDQRWEHVKYVQIYEVVEVVWRRDSYDQPMYQHIEVKESRRE